MTKHPFPDADLARLAGVSVDEWRSAQPAARLEAVRLRGAVPAGCGFDGAIPTAPARGPVEVFSPREVMQTEAGNFRIVRTGYMGATALRRADAFDVMEAQAARQAKARNKDHRPLFTTAQVEAGRTYGHLAERHDARGARCSSIEAQSRGAGGGSYIDAVVAEGQRLERMRAAIGDGWAMTIQRTSPHGDVRRAIRARTLVDMVCIEGKTVAEVLERFGWNRSVKYLAPLRVELSAALDRLHGL
jgi:hypothetical protein